MSISLAALVGVLVGLVLVMITLPLAGWVARRDGDPKVGTIIRWGIVIKIFVAAPAQLVVSNVFYHGVSDFRAYHNDGAAAAVNWGHGIFTLPPGSSSGVVFVKLVAGAIYSLIGVSELGGFFVFAWLSLLGFFLFYRAFRIAFPEGNHRRYAALLFLLPSMLFWTSAIGKDALMALALGAAAYGGARALKYQRLGFTIIGAGSVLAILIRPWMALMYCAAFGFAYLLRKPQQGSANSKVTKYAGLTLLLVFGVFLAARTSSALHVESLNATSINQVLAKNVVRGGIKAAKGKAGGGSHFSASRDPVKFPISAFTVIFRPLPIEAHGVTSLGVSLESLVVLGLCIRVFKPTVWPALKRTWRDPNVALIVAYTLLFIFVYSSVSDFGNLVRERAQLLPFLFMLLAYNRAPLRRPHPQVLLSPGWREIVPPAEGSSSRPPFSVGA